jgi:hypothetical protein
MKLLAIISTLLTLVFAGLYFRETMRTEQLRDLVNQRNKAIVTLKTVTNGLVNMSSIQTDSLLNQLANVTELGRSRPTINVVGTTFPNPERHVWDYFGIELKSDSSRQLVNVELFKP